MCAKTVEGHTPGPWQAAHDSVTGAAYDLAAALVAAPSPLDFKPGSSFDFDGYFAAYCAWLETRAAALTKARIDWRKPSEAAS